MVLDLQWFGYGVGLVMLGWFAGMIVAQIFSSFRNAR